MNSRRSECDCASKPASISAVRSDESSSLSARQIAARRAVSRANSTCRPPTVTRSHERSLALHKKCQGYGSSVTTCCQAARRGARPAVRRRSGARTPTPIVTQSGRTDLEESVVPTAALTESITVPSERRSGHDHDVDRAWIGRWFVLRKMHRLARLAAPRDERCRDGLAGHRVEHHHHARGRRPPAAPSLVPTPLRALLPVG